ncbi:MAG: hypothetical protein ACI4S4_05405 [Candidatus Ornithospirochaeta sp.]
MNKRAIIFLLAVSSAFLLFSNSISFSGGKSRLVMREGEKSVSLTEGAYVKSGDMTINADEMVLSGEGWKTVSGKGSVSISDSGKGFSIRTSSIWYDREDEVLVISSWFEIDDTKEELYAQAGSLRYDMESEKLEMGIGVTLLKMAEGDVMKCTAESVVYDKESGIISLRGGAKVEWKGDVYEAQTITVDTSDNTISLNGRIRGTING